ncbi:MAG: transketolase-like TK C-terminal-containing protein, partial [Gemmatimonadota bacterium]
AHIGFGLDLEAGTRVPRDGAVGGDEVGVREEQDAAYQASVLPAGVRRVAIEAAHPMSWHRWVGDTGTSIGISTFGASAPAPTLYREYGITAEAVVRAVRG